MKEAVSIQQKNNSPLLLFLLAATLMLFTLAPFSDMIQGSGDCNETWKVVTSFFSDEPYASYVMYKGMWAFLPYVILHQIENALQLSAFTLIKLFHACLFGYIAAVGLPGVLSKLLNKEKSRWGALLLIVGCYLVCRVHFKFISVDPICFAVLTATCNAFMKLKNKEYYFKNKWVHIFSCGILLGFLAAFSGQFLPAAAVLLMYSFSCVSWKPITKNTILRFGCAFALFIVGIALVKVPEQIYNKQAAQYAKEKGVFYLSGTEWTVYHLTLDLAYKDLWLEDVRGKSIAMVEGRDPAAPGVFDHGNQWTLRESINIILKHPIDFLMRWFDRLFLGLSNFMDPYYSQNPSLFWLTISYTVLFFSFYTLVHRCNQVRKIFQTNTLILLAFLLPALVPSLRHTEMRYYIAFETFMIGVVLFEYFSNDAILLLREKTVRLLEGQVQKKPIGEWRCSKLLCTWCLFVFICILLFANMQELMYGGPNPIILFQLF